MAGYDALCRYRRDGNRFLTLEHVAVSRLQKSVVQRAEPFSDCDVRDPTRITRSLVEEFSGKVFQYEEILPLLRNTIRIPSPLR